jgi:GNAT superfamily N-acetyltransferase
MGKDGSGKKAKGGKSGSQSQTDVVTTSKQMRMAAHQSAMITIRAALFDDTGNDKDMAKGLEPMCKFDRNGLTAAIKFYPGNALPTELTEFTFDLAKTNMEEVYDSSGYGWADFDKQEELCDNASRFLVATNADDEPVAFVHFRISLQGDLREQLEGEASLIVYDLQVTAECQRKGLGKHMMMVLELIARKNKLSFLLVPVVHGNEAADNFFRQTLKGYVRDVNEDGLHDVRNIFSKCLDKQIKERASAAAKAAADVQALAKQLMEMKAPTPAAQTTPKKAPKQAKEQSSPASVSAFEFSAPTEKKQQAKNGEEEVQEAQAAQ